MNERLMIMEREAVEGHRVGIEILDAQRLHPRIYEKTLKFKDGASNSICDKLMR